MKKEGLAKALLYFLHYFQFILFLAEGYLVVIRKNLFNLN